MYYSLELTFSEHNEIQVKKIEYHTVNDAVAVRDAIAFSRNFMKNKDKSAYAINIRVREYIVGFIDDLGNFLEIKCPTLFTWNFKKFEEAECQIQKLIKNHDDEYNVDD